MFYEIKKTSYFWGEEPTSTSLFFNELKNAEEYRNSLKENALQVCAAPMVTEYDNVIKIYGRENAYEVIIETYARAFAD